MLLMMTSVCFLRFFPMFFKALFRKDRFGFLFLLIGVWTEIMKAFVGVMTPFEFSVALSLPALTFLSISWFRFGSFMGLTPLFTALTTSGFMSTAVTWKPASANKAAVGKPT